MKSDINNLFYNLVPGGLFTIIWYRIISTKYDLVKIVDNFQFHSDTFNITIFLIASFIIGFFLHSIAGAIRKYTSVEKYIFFSGKKEKKDIFDDTNKKLIFHNQIRFANFFSDRSAYWGNLAIGFLLTLLLYMALFKFLITQYVLILLFLITISLINFYQYRQKEIDTVMK